MASPSGMRSYKLTQFGAPLTEVIEFGTPGAARDTSAAAGQRLRRLPQRPAYRRPLFRSGGGSGTRPCAGREPASCPRHAIGGVVEKLAPPYFLLGQLNRDNVALLSTVAAVLLTRWVSSDRFYAVILALTFLVGVKLAYDAVRALA